MHLHPIFAIGLPHWGSAAWLFFIAIILLGPVLWLCALISCIRNESSSGNTKVVWLLIILLIHFIGPLLYFVVRRPQRIRELGR